MVNQVFTNGTAGDVAVGLYYGGGAGQLNAYNNTIVVNGTALTGASMPNMAIGINGSNPPIDIRNNVLVCAGSNGFNGNTGIGLAMVCAAKGYPLVVTMADSFSIERRRLMRFLGAKVVLTPRAAKGFGMYQKAKELADANGWFLARQFETDDNATIHELNRRHLGHDRGGWHALQGQHRQRRQSIGNACQLARRLRHHVGGSGSVVCQSSGRQLLPTFQ